LDAKGRSRLARIAAAARWGHERIVDPVQLAIPDEVLIAGLRCRVHGTPAGDWWQKQLTLLAAYVATLPPK